MCSRRWCEGLGLAVRAVVAPFEPEGRRLRPPSRAWQPAAAGRTRRSTSFPTVKLLALMRLLQLRVKRCRSAATATRRVWSRRSSSGIVVDEASVLRWISDVLEFSHESYEFRCLRRWVGMGGARARGRGVVLNEEFLATRESAELRAATVQMGYSLRACSRICRTMPRGAAALARHARAQPALRLERRCGCVANLPATLPSAMCGHGRRIRYWSP